MICRMYTLIIVLNRTIFLMYMFRCEVGWVGWRVGRDVTKWVGGCFFPGSQTLCDEE